MTVDLERLKERAGSGTPINGQTVLALIEELEAARAELNFYNTHHPAAWHRQDERVDAVRQLLRDVVVAAGRMSDRWAEADESVRKQLWSELHRAASAAEEEVYPLESTDPYDRVRGSDG